MQSGTCRDSDLFVKQGNQSAAVMEENGGSVPGKRLNGVPVSIQEKIRIFIGEQYDIIGYPRASTTTARYYLGSRIIRILSEEELAENQMRIVYRTGIKISADSSDKTCGELIHDKEVVIQDKIRTFMDKQYNVIGKLSGSSEVRCQLAFWVIEILNRNQSFPFQMRLSIGPDGYIIDPGSFSLMTARCAVPVQQSQYGEGRNEQRAEEFVITSNRQSATCRPGAESGFADVSNEEDGDLRPEVSTSDRQSATCRMGAESVPADVLQLEEEGGKHLEEEFVNTPDGKSATDSDPSRILKPSQSVEEGYFSLEGKNKVLSYSEQLALQPDQKEP